MLSRVQSDLTLQVSRLTVVNSASLPFQFALETVPTSKGSNAIPPKPHVLNYLQNSCCHFSYSCCHVGKALLKALLEIKHEIEMPVEGNACRRGCKAVENKHEFSSKGSSFPMTEELCHQWRTVPGRQVAVEAGGELSVYQCPGSVFKGQVVLYSNYLIHNAKLDLDRMWSNSNIFYYVDKYQNLCFSEKYLQVRNITYVKTSQASHCSPAIFIFF